MADSRNTTELKSRQVIDAFLIMWVVIFAFLFMIKTKKYSIGAILIFAFPFAFIYVITRIRTIKNEDANDSKFLATLREWALATKIKKKKAILIGINDYIDKPLKGTINDTIDAKNLFKQFAKIDNEDIVVLNDSNASKRNILTVLDETITNAQAGDTIYLWWSSHGTQVNTTNLTDEPDGLEEAWVVWGYSLFKPDLNFLITESELRQIFAKLPDGAKVIAVIDTCHSEFYDGKIGKSYPKPTISISNSVPTVATKEGSIPDIVVLSACKSNEVTPDVNIEGRDNGLFSYLIIDELRKDSKLTVTQLYNNVIYRSKQMGYNQTPQISGSDLSINNKFIL